MGIGTSIFLFAIGAILRFAVDVQTEGFNLHTIGVILMIVGVVGGLLSLMFWTSWGGVGPRDGYGPRDNRADRDIVVERSAPDVVIEERPVRRRAVVVERETRL